MANDPSRLQVLSETECLSLMTRLPVGRVVVSMDAMPAAFPVNFMRIGRDICFQTAAGTKLAAAVNHTVVGFQTDMFDANDESGWSVMVVGHARLVTDPAEQALLHAAGVRSWAVIGPAQYVAIDMDRITGRRLRPAREPAHPTSPAATCGERAP